MINQVKIILSFLILIILSNCTNYSRQNNKLSSKNSEITEQLQFIDTLQFYSFQYFINETNEENGLIKDRSTDHSPASTAASGFGLVVFAVGIENGWITRKEASERTLKMLRFFYNSEQSQSPDATGYEGFYYHFLKMGSGKREWASELSTIDTGLLLAGIIFAKNYYINDDSVETEIRKLSNKIINRVNWDFMTLSESEKFRSTISLGWKPESGFHNVGWVGYNEALVLYIIAAGSGMKNVEAAYNTWLNYYDWRTPYPDLQLVSFPPLFGHQYSHIFIDFRGIADSYMRKKGFDYFENSRRATIVQRLYAIDNPLGWEGYDSLTWGLTASDGPGPNYNFDEKEFYRYTARGTSGPDLIQNDDGTIAPTAAAGSIVFTPQLVIPTLMSMYENYGSKGLWGKYGFHDSFNPTLNWYDPDYIAIDQAPIVLMIENWKNGFVWNYMMKDPIIKNGLHKLGFEQLN